MKKTLALLLVLLTVFCLSIQVFASETDAANATIIGSGNCGSNVTWTLDEEGTLTISGTGDMYDYLKSENPCPWFAFLKDIRYVVIEEGVTSIGDWAFFNCTSLTDIILPEGLSRIGTGAFANTVSLKDIILPDSVTDIGASAFSGGRLRAIAIPRGVTAISQGMFDDCVYLQQIIIPDSVAEIGQAAFQGCRSLSFVSLPDSIVTIGSWAFDSCSKLNHVLYTGSDRGNIAIASNNVPLEDSRWHCRVEGDEIQWVDNCINAGRFCEICDDFIYRNREQDGSHVYTDSNDTTCNECGEVRILSVPMHRMYDPNSGEHFYTGSEVERDFLVEAGWHYEGVGFNFPEDGKPVYRLYEPVHGEHLYTMDEAEKEKLLSWGWNDEGVAFNSAGTDEVPQYRLHNPNANRGGYHFTGSTEERDFLISIGWIDQGIGWYSCLE